MPLGSAESLRWSYKSGLGRLVDGYATYLYRNIHETAAPGPRKNRTSGPSQAPTMSKTNMTCSTHGHFNAHLVSPDNSTGKFNETTSPNDIISRICKRNGSSEDFRLNWPKEDDLTVAENRTTLNSASGYRRGEEVGLLVIEPGRSIIHNVHHHPCESRAIQQALVMRIIDAQDLEQNRNFFSYAEKVLHSLLRQKDDFELQTN